MYVRNPDRLNKNIVYLCNKNIGEWLISKGVCLLSKVDDTYYFSKSEELEAARKIMPFYLKWMEMI